MQRALKTSSTPGTTQIDILSSSTGTDRAAGVVRYELAQLLALQRQSLESLRLHALNRELHHRFFRGRYRLAMSLEMIANPEHYLPNDKETWDNLGETLEILYRMRADGWHAPGECRVPDGQRNLESSHPAVRR